MSSEIEHIEYDRDINPYPSFGKKYNGEKAIISMTSWKMRIATCSKTLFSLIKQCPGFHIVLVLSEEEFPQKEKELPENLMVFVENELIELLWVYKNYKSFKKWIFTSQKYPDVPIISADDGCIYVRNYAEELYQTWLKHPKAIISEVKFENYGIYYGGGGCGILYPPNVFPNYEKSLTDLVINTLHDDGYTGCYAKYKNVDFYFIDNRTNNPRTLAFIETENKSSVWKNGGCSNTSILSFKELLKAS